MWLRGKSWFALRALGSDWLVGAHGWALAKETGLSLLGGVLDCREQGRMGPGCLLQPAAARHGGHGAVQEPSLTHGKTSPGMLTCRGRGQDRRNLVPWMSQNPWINHGCSWPSLVLLIPWENTFLLFFRTLWVFYFPAKISWLKKELYQNWIFTKTFAFHLPGNPTKAEPFTLFCSLWYAICNTQHQIQRTPNKNVLNERMNK